MTLLNPKLVFQTYFKLVFKPLSLWKTRVENPKNSPWKHPSQKIKVPTRSKKLEPIEPKNLNAKSTEHPCTHLV